MFGLFLRIGFICLAVLVMTGLLWGILKIFGHSLKVWRALLYTLIFLGCVGLIPLALNPLFTHWLSQILDWRLGFFLGFLLAFLAWKYLFWRDLKINGFKTLGYLIAVVLATSLVLRVWTMIFLTAFQNMH